MYDQVKFFRRRQFVLGPEYVDYEGWKRLEVEDNCLLTVHPDLMTTVVEEHTQKYILLGYALDPYQLGLTEKDLLQRLICSTRSAGDVISGLEKLNGRFILIVKCREDLWLFHDAVALRQIQYCQDNKGRTWCASQAETLAECLGYEYDEEVLSYRDMPKYQVSKDEFWLMNDRTPYREVRNLLANHYLDLRQAKVFRYWPFEGCIPSLSVDESIHRCNPILQNSIKAAAIRFDLKMAISAGGDSRKSLAAAREVKDKLFYFSHTPTNKVDLVKDVEIPARLLPKLGLKHHDLGWKIMTDEFKKYYQCSATWAREGRGHIAYNLLSYFGPEATVLNSNISEVAQNLYWLPKSKINGEGFAVISGLNHPLAIAEFQNWADGARRACEEANMRIMDLFFLEQRMGRWATAAFAEYDITHETFNPYNNRYLHCLMLAINERYRRDRLWDVPLKQIKKMWPEVLSEPINPQVNMIKQIQQHIRRYIIHKTITPWFPVYEYLRYIKQKRRFRK